MALMFRAIVFFGLITAALGSEKLDVLVNAAASFSATIQQQLETLQSVPSPAELAEKTIDYSEAKTTIRTIAIRNPSTHNAMKPGGIRFRGRRLSGIAG